MPQKTKRVYGFASFRLDPEEHVLLNGGARVPLTPKAFDTLLALVESSGHILQKDDLLTRVWPDTFVEEGTLARNISTLRKALGDDSEGQNFIETVPRRGYRFVAPVQQFSFPEAATPAATEAAEEKAERGRSQTRPATRGRNLGILGAVLALAVLAGIYVISRHAARARASAAGTIVLAVLPFENLSGDAAQQFFADGFTEEMITDLGNLQPDRLAVIARTSAIRYQGTTMDPLAIGRELGAQYVLTGSLRREADRARITARLIRTGNGTTVWAANYDRNVSNILALQSEVATSIAAEISLKLSPEINARLRQARTLDPEAYEDYLEGRYFWNKRTAASYVKAIDYFQKAIARDSRYAEAYSGLADAYALLGSLPNDQVPRREAMPKAKEAALTALRLDDSMAEAHTSLAFEEMHYEWNWPASEREFRRALQLNPSYATAHQWYAYWLAAQGKHDEALAQLSLAEKADPLSIIIKTDAAELLGTAGRYPEGVQAAQKALEMDSGFTLAHYFLAENYLAQRIYPPAIDEYEKMLAMDRDNIWALAGLARAWAATGKPAEARTLLHQTLGICRNQSDCALQIAGIYASLGEKDEAFAWLETAWQNREGALILLNGRLLPLASLRSDARYAELATRMDLPERELTAAQQ